MTHASTLTVALVSDVFFSPDGLARFDRTLAEAKSRGADLTLLPELPLNPWSPACTRGAGPA
jgi:predicted amidohydrolase